MKKRKKEIEVEPFNGAVYNSTFLKYDVDGKIIAISNEKLLGDDVLEIENELIKDFQLGTKHFHSYKIDYFLNLKKGIVQKEEVLVNKLNLLYIIPAVDHYKNEITLLHNSNSWELTIRENVSYENLDLTFFLCKKDDPSFLYSTLMFNLNNRKIKFKTEFEKNLKLFSVITMKKFNSYGIKDIL
jgi:hypothetical protein